MATIDFSTLGVSSSNKVQCNDLRVFNESDDNYHLELSVASAPSANYSVNFPPEAQDNTTLLTDGTDIDITQLDVNGATSKSSAADSDELILYDATGLSNKKISISDLKSSIEELPSGTSGQILVHDGSSFAAASSSGDVVVDSSGEFTIQTGAVENSMLAADCVNGDKIADDSIGSEHIVDGAVGSDALAGDCINADKIADAALSSEHFSASCVSTSSLADDCVTSAKLAAAIEVDNSINCPIFEFGTGTTRWRMKMDASNNLVLQVSTDTGSTYADKQVFQAS